MITCPQRRQAFKKKACSTPTTTPLRLHHQHMLLFSYRSTHAVSSPFRRDMPQSKSDKQCGQIAANTSQSRQTIVCDRRDRDAPWQEQNGCPSCVRSQHTSLLFAVSDILDRILPLPVNEPDISNGEQEEFQVPEPSTSSVVVTRTVAPPYGQRKGWKPTTSEDHGPSY